MRRAFIGEQHELQSVSNQNVCREWPSTFGHSLSKMITSEHQTLACRSRKAVDVGPCALLWSVSSKNPHLVTQRYSRDTPVQRHVSNEACAALGHVSDDRTRQHVSNDRLRPTDVHAALLWTPGHCRAFTSASTALPAEFLSSKGLRKLAPTPS